LHKTDYGTIAMLLNNRRNEVLEANLELAHRDLVLYIFGNTRNAASVPLDRALHDKHFLRTAGRNSYCGQVKTQ
jgi:hypothetical protein